MKGTNWAAKQTLEMFPEKGNTDSGVCATPTASCAITTAAPESGKRWAFDWGSRVGKLVFVNIDDPAEVLYAEKLEYFIREQKPAALYGEATFESYEVDRYNYVLGVAHMFKVPIYTLRTSITAHVRGDREKDDLGDARVIAEVAKAGRVHFRTARPRGQKEEGYSALRKKINKTLVKLRREGYPKTDPVLQAALNSLPAVVDVPQDLRSVVMRNKKFSPSFTLSYTIAARLVREIGGNRKDFDRQTGLYGAGYPSLLRSNALHHGLGPKLRKKGDPAVRKERMRTLRRASHWIWKVSGVCAATSAPKGRANRTATPEQNF